MSGIMIASKTACGTTMFRLVHEGKVIDRIEVDDIKTYPEELMETSEEEIARRVWDERDSNR